MKFKTVLLALALGLTLSACSMSNDRAIKALEGVGLTDIQLTGYSFFACSEDDTFNQGFRAKNAKGDPVEGAVCGGWFKGATVRFD